MMWDDDKIFKGCCQGRRKAQAALYEKYASSMRAVCRRYLACVLKVKMSCMMH
jgi:hypothetical protein